MKKIYLIIILLLVCNPAFLENTPEVSIHHEIIPHETSIILLQSGNTLNALKSEVRQEMRVKDLTANRILKGKTPSTAIREEVQKGRRLKFLDFLSTKGGNKGSNPANAI